MGLLCKEKAENLLDSNSSITMDLPKHPPSSSSSSTKRAHHQDQDLQQEDSEPLDCPRCCSRNTKFCYYNNYNKSQPRHFCKACKRHWTKGGTLRNVPVGGCRKNKRLKTSGGGSDKSAATAAAIDAAVAASLTTCHDLFLGDQEGFKDLSDDDYQKSISNLLFDAFMDNNSNEYSNRYFSFSGIDSLPFDADGSGEGGGNRSSSISGIQDNLQHVYNYDHCSNNSQLESLESSSTTITTVTQSNGIFYPPWKSGGKAAAEMADYWSLNDLDSLISADLNVPWDDDDEEIHR